MRILIVEDDFTSRMFMRKFLSKHGECDVAVDGIEAIDAYISSLNEGHPYNLICLDIMMPRLDGISALKSIREIEKKKIITIDKRVKIIITTSMKENEIDMSGFDSEFETVAYKPIKADKFAGVMKNLGLIE